MEATAAEDSDSGPGGFALQWLCWSCPSCPFLLSSPFSILVHAIPFAVYMFSPVCGNPGELSVVLSMYFRKSVFPLLLHYSSPLGLRTSSSALLLPPTCATLLRSTSVAALRHLLLILYILRRSYSFMCKLLPALHTSTCIFSPSQPSNYPLDVRFMRWLRQLHSILSFFRRRAEANCHRAMRFTPSTDPSESLEDLIVIIGMSILSWRTSVVNAIRQDSVTASSSHTHGRRVSGDTLL